MRPAYDRLATLDDLLRRAAELSAKTLIFDVEPLVAHWESGQAALDQGRGGRASSAAGDCGRSGGAGTGVRLALTQADVLE